MRDSKLINLKNLSKQLGYHTNRLRRVLRLKYKLEIELIKINNIFYIKIEDISKLVKVAEENRMICRAVIRRIVNVVKIKALKEAQETIRTIKEVVEAFEDSVIDRFNFWLSPESYKKNREVFRQRLMQKISRNYL